MDNFIEKILEQDLGNIIDKHMNEWAETDMVYKKDIRDEDEWENKYLALEIDKQDRIVIDDYIERIRMANARCVELAFLAGIRDTIKFLNGLGLLKG